MVSIKNVLKLAAVKARTGKGRTSIYDGVRNGTFPAPIPLGTRAVGWLESEVDEWIERRIDARIKRMSEAQR